MLKKLEPGRTVVPGGRLGLLIAPAVLLLMGGCAERDRLTFPNPGDGVGPVTTIDQPSATDTTVDQGIQFLVSGRAVDRDGVDTVYFLVISDNEVQPYPPHPAADTVWFGFPISTFGRSGETIRVEVYGVDSQGNQGAHSSRQITVR
jgi:hypothetical protein